MAATRYATVTATRSLNVRKDPGNRARVIGALFSGDRVELTGLCRDGWAQIVWKDSTAWVNASFLSENICQTSEEE